jgi:hypothetical protein
MKTQLLQDLQESGSTPPAAGEAAAAPSQPRRKPVVLADDARTPSIQPPQIPAMPAGDTRTPSNQPSQPPADDAHTPPVPPRRPAVWHGPAAQRVDAGTPGQPLAPRAARRAPDLAARGAGVAIEAWADRVAQAGGAESRPAPAQQPGATPVPERPTMDVAAFFGREERRGAVSPPAHDAAAAPPRAAAAGDSAPAHHVAPVPVAEPSGSAHDAPAGAAAVPRRPHLNDVPPLGASPDDTTLLRTEVPGLGERAPAPQRNATPPATAAAPGIPAHEHAADPLPREVARATASEARTQPVLEKHAASFPAAADTAVSPWRRLWKRRVVSWSVAGVLAVAVGGGAGWLLAGSRDDSVPVAANTVPAETTRGAQAYVAREEAPAVKAPQAAAAPDANPVPAAPSAAPAEAAKPPPPAAPAVQPAAPVPAPEVAPAASRSVATVDLDPSRRAARHAAPVRKRAAAKARRAPTPEARPAPAEPTPRERREETLMQCRAHGYDERQCIRRGCAMTRYGFACRG